VRALRVTLVVAVLVAGAAALLHKRTVEGWAPTHDEAVLIHCRHDARWCPAAARTLWDRGERKAATDAARRGCLRDDAESCAWLGLALCADTRTYADSIDALAHACTLGDDTSCYTLRDFVIDERWRARVPKTDRPVQAWIGAAMTLAREDKAEQAREVMTAVDAPLSKELLEAALAINAGQPFQLSSSAGPEAAILRAGGDAAAKGANVTLALFEAWRDAGEPDLRTSEVLGVHGVVNGDPTCEVVRPGSEQLAADAPIAERLHAFHWLDRDFSPGAVALRERLLAPLRARAGDDAYLTVWLVAEGPAGVLDDAELAALERASLTAWAPPRAEVRERCRSEGTTACVTQDLFPDTFGVFFERLRQTEQKLPVEKRRALGQALVTLGEKVARGPWFHDVFYGAAWMKLGAELAGDDDALKRERALRQRIDGFGPDDPFSRLTPWPLAACNRESLARLDGDQVSQLRALMELPP
jgi:hypothetical protein